MAERIVSPAVFTNEIDSTFLGQGIQQIGGAVVGPFTRGPAYSPTICRTVAELEDLFGIAEGKYYQPFTAREYLKHQGVVTIVRVGDLGGYKQENALVIKATVTDTSDFSGSSSGSLANDEVEVGDEVVIGVLANTLWADNGQPAKDAYYDGFLGSTIDNDTKVMFYEGEVTDEDGNTVVVGNLESTLYLRRTVFETDETTGEVLESVQSLKANYDSDYDFSINPKAPDSLQNIFGRLAKKNGEPAYLYSYFENAQERIFNNVMNGAKYEISVEAQVMHLFLNMKTQQQSKLQTILGFMVLLHLVVVLRKHLGLSHRRSVVNVTTFSKFGHVTKDTTANREVKIGIYNVRTHWFYPRF